MQHKQKVSSKIQCLSYKFALGQIWRLNLSQTHWLQESFPNLSSFWWAENAGRYGQHISCVAIAYIGNRDDGKDSYSCTGLPCLQVWRQAWCAGVLSRDAEVAGNVDALSWRLLLQRRNLINCGDSYSCLNATSCGTKVPGGVFICARPSHCGWCHKPCNSIAADLKHGVLGVEWAGSRGAYLNASHVYCKQFISGGNNAQIPCVVCCVTSWHWCIRYWGLIAPCAYNHCISSK